LKVALLNDSFPPVIDGVANVVLNYARIMTEDNLADVMVATPKYPDANYYSYPYYVVPFASIDTTKIVKGYRAGLPLDFKELKDMSDFHPDIIHTHCPVASAYVARMLRSATAAPLIFTYHTKFDEDIARAVSDKKLQEAVAKVLVNNIESCDEVWVVSNGAGENMRSLGYKGDYRVVSNGVDFEKGRVDEATVNKVTKDYDLPKGVPVYLFVGRIIEYKGIPFILDAMSRLKEAGEDFRMVFIGSGPDLEKYKNEAREKGLYENPSSDKSKVYFTGPVYDRDVLRAWNTRADLFIFPSTYDTNGIVVREAAACGLASLLIKGSCAAEGITDGRNGYLVDQSGEDIFRLLLSVGKDLDRVYDVGQKAMDEIYISWADSVHRAYERYGEILELKAAGKFNVNSHLLFNQLDNMTNEVENALVQINMSQKRFVNNMFDNVDDLWDDIQVEFSGALSDMYDYVQEIYSGMKGSVKTLHSEVSNFKEEIIDKMKKF